MVYLYGISVATAELACAPQHPDNQLGWLVVVDRYRARQLVYLCHEHRHFLLEAVMVKLDALLNALGRHIVHGEDAVLLIPLDHLCHRAAVFAGECPVHAVLHDVVVR